MAGTGKLYLARRALEVDTERQVAAVVKAAELGGLLHVAHLERVRLGRLLLGLGLGHAQRGGGAAGRLGPLWRRRRRGERTVKAGVSQLAASSLTK